MNESVRQPQQLTPNVKLLQKIALVSQGKVLLLRRDAASFSRPGAWDLPGGNSEWPATTEPTVNLHQIDAAREVEEETGIGLTPDQFALANLIHLETHFDPERQIFTVLLGWRIVLPDSFGLESIRLSQEHTDYLWSKLDEASLMDFGGNKGQFMQRILQEAAA